MAHNNAHGPITNLTELESQHSLVGANGPISNMGGAVDQEGTPLYNRGLSQGNPTSSPFHLDNASTDHLVDLLTEDAESTRLNAPSPAQSSQYMGPGPSGDLDLEGQQPGIFTAGLGQNDGKKLGDEDLHVGMLHSTYSYTHAAGTPWQTDAQVGNTPSLSPFQDLTSEYVTGPDGDPADKIPEWNYMNGGPSDGRY